MRDGTFNATEPVGEADRGAVREDPPVVQQRKPAYSFLSTQPVVIAWAASSRQAPNPAEPAPYW